MRKKTRLEEMREAHRRAEFEIRVTGWLVLAVGVSLLAWAAWIYCQPGVLR